MFLIELVKCNHIVDTIQELRCECFLKRFLNNILRMLIFRFGTFVNSKTNTPSKVFQLAGTNVGCHYNNCVSEINTSSQTVS